LAPFVQPLIAKNKTLCKTLANSTAVSASLFVDLHIAETCKAIYKAKDGKQPRSFNALEWLVTTCSHVPDRGEQMVRYYWYYSKASRDKRKKENRGN
jgi:hypothetical protein